MVDHNRVDYRSIAKAATKSDGINRKTDDNVHLQLDADFACYQAANIEQSIKENCSRLHSIINYERKLAGAGVVNVHTTLGLKGGRTEIATVKPYQDDRKKHRDPARKARVDELRSYLSTYETERTKPFPWTLQEADDGMIQTQNKRVAEFGIDSSIIRSDDKDLWMGMGKHIKSSGEIYIVDGYGSTRYEEVGNKEPKLVGKGTSWFWHQMLMGDGADTIPGLPKINVALANEFFPTKKRNPKRKPLLCGEGKAYEIMKSANDDASACRLVREFYHGYYEGNADEMFIEQAFLLWMRRDTSLNDVLKFLREECGWVGAKFSDSQKNRLRVYIEKAKSLQDGVVA